MLDCLADGAHSVLYIANRLGKDMDSLPVKRLIQKELIYMISLTPTDLLHATGEYCQFDKEISQMAISILAKRRGMQPEGFQDFAVGAFTDRVCSALIECVLVEKGIAEKNISDDLISMLLNDDIYSCHLAKLDFKFNSPIVGLGAPAGSWLTKVAKRLGCEIIIPNDSEVANAIGTVSGSVNETLEALIRYDFHTKKYIVHLPNKRVTCDDLESASELAEQELVVCSKELAGRMGVKKYNATVAKEMVESKEGCGSDNAFVELKIKVTISANAKNINS